MADDERRGIEAVARAIHEAEHPDGSAPWDTLHPATVEMRLASARAAMRELDRVRDARGDVSLKRTSSAEQQADDPVFLARGGLVRDARGDDEDHGPTFADWKKERDRVRDARGDERGRYRCGVDAASEVTCDRCPDPDGCIDFASRLPQSEDHEAGIDFATGYLAASSGCKGLTDWQAENATRRTIAAYLDRVRDTRGDDEGHATGIKAADRWHLEAMTQRAHRGAMGPTVREMTEGIVAAYLAARSPQGEDHGT